MKQKTIIVSCVPNLTPAQEAGFLRLLTELEERELCVYFFSHNSYDSLARFEPQVSQYDHLKYRYYYYKCRFLIDAKKWRARLTWWYALPNVKQEKEALQTRIQQAVQLFCATNPDMFLCWNPNAAPNGVHANVARVMGIKTGGTDWGFLPDTLIIDPKGTLALSEVFNRPVLYPDEALVENAGNEVYESLKDKSVSLYAQQSKPLAHELQNATGVKILLIGIDRLDSGTHPVKHPERKGLLPFHTSPYEQAVAIAAAHPSFTVIFKPHPSHNEHGDDIQVNPNLWVLNINPDQLIDWADVVVCTGSKMEMSVLLKNKPLVNIGAGLLYKKGCSYEVEAAHELASMILKAKEQGVTPAQLHAFKKFLGYLKHYYLFSYADGADNRTALSRFIETF